MQPLFPRKLSFLLALAACATGSAVGAQTLKPSPSLQETILPDAELRQLPIFWSGERMAGQPDKDMVIEGNATLRRMGTVIRADRITYSEPTDRATAQGNVRINRKGDIFEGDYLELKIGAFEGFFTAPRFELLKNQGYGQADKIEFHDDAHFTVHNATYSTCKPNGGLDWIPDWVFRANRMTLDTEADSGVAEGAVLEFQGVSLLPLPAISFPLSERRKSGFLPPTFGLGSDGGFELLQPYYWNIAPNRDATFYPKLMTLRGVDLGMQYRYLEPDYFGDIRASILPNDRLTGTNRWSLGTSHQGRINTPLGVVGVGMNINRVSDDNYWRDFTSSVNGTSNAINSTTSGGAAITQRLLPTDLIATWSQGYGGGVLTSTARVLKWQTLQDVNAPIVPPFDRAPQITARYGVDNASGWDWSVDTDFTQFEADRTRTLQPNAQRGMAQLQVSHPWLLPGGFITPKFQVHATSYQFDAALDNGSRTGSAIVPTFSLDAGVVLERETQLFGRNLVQTLEPRAFYVYTPWRDQSMLPNYDTAANDFNFATIYTENAFVGHDKIADNNLLTLGVTTRFLDAGSGAQLARFGVAQRLRFDEQKVTLNSSTAPAQAGLSDILLGASINADPQWALDSTVQYNPRTEKSIRSTIGARYNPGNYRVLNAAYSYQREQSEQLAVSWQWPINNLWGDTGQELGAGRGQGAGRYYSVGRLNYSLFDGRMVDTLLGVEYDAGCWLARMVLQRTQTSITTSTSSLMFQIEFVGFTRLGLGGNPVQTLPLSVSRYQNLRDTHIVPPSRFTNYD